MGQSAEALSPTEQDFLDALREAVTQGNFRINPNNFAGWQDTCSCEKCRSQITIFEFITGLTGQQMPVHGRLPREKALEAERNRKPLGRAGSKH